MPNFVKEPENSIQIINGKITKAELKQIAELRFGDLVKAVVDIERKIMAIGGELHADEETLLIENGSQQANLWGINLYPDGTQEQMVEFDSMINIRPGQGNRSRGVENEEIQNKILEIVRNLIE